MKIDIDEYSLGNLENALLNRLVDLTTVGKIQWSHEVDYPEHPSGSRVGYYRFGDGPYLSIHESPYKLCFRGSHGKVF